MKVRDNIGGLIMPRKTKEQEKLENKKENVEKKSTKIAKKDLLKKEKQKSTNNKSKAKNIELITEKEEKNSSVSRKKSSKSTSSKPDKKTTKVSIKKISSKKNTTAKSSSKNKKSSLKKSEILEYYDLPYRYNQTIVKVLAQTPRTLFIYWDISDEDRENYKKQYGDNFFETTKPILKVYNDTLHYSFEVEINDFANSWYLHIADSKCDYRVELGRRPIIKNENLNTDYIYISTSNKIESPNDKILFNREQKMVYFRNVKSGNISAKSISNYSNISFIRNMGKIYNIYDLYKAIYQNENIEEFYNLSNPSSGNPSSGSLSSKFK